MREKKIKMMFKVVCSNCGKIRLWDNLSECPSHCWECDGEHTHTQVEITL